MTETNILLTLIVIILSCSYLSQVTVEGSIITTLIITGCFFIIIRQVIFYFFNPFIFLLKKETK